MKKILTIALLAIGMMAQAQEFVKGADIGWITQIENRGQYQLVDMKGQPVEAHDLMKQLDMSAVRIRVWVNPKKDPKDGVAYCGLDDVVQKAVRAKDKGMDVMIDFHYSNWWADPGKQIIPQEWKDCNISQLCDSMAAHTIETLEALRKKGVEPRWIQVGNEIAPGFMHPMGKADEHPAEFARLFKTGYEACKKVFPKAQVILHIDNGYDLGRTTRIIDILKQHGADFDLMGWSLYPAMNWVTNEVDENWQKKVDQCIANSYTLYNIYGKESMLVEVGMPDKDENIGRDCISYIIRNHGPHLHGIFWWEPFSTPDFHYGMGALKHYGENKYGPNEALKEFYMSKFYPVLPTGSVAPEIVLPRFNGEGSVKLSDYKGRYVLIDFWATWCGDCRREMPIICGALEAYKGKIEVLSVSFDNKREALAGYLEKNPTDWTIVADFTPWKESAVTKAYQLGWIPTFYIIDPDGKIAGSGITGEQLKSELQRIFGYKLVWSDEFDVDRRPAEHWSF